jgi:BirA family biotin operon repressor/biotin-[acetyl-CoA-carboxylase] ligase
MFEAIYKITISPGKFSEYAGSWRIVANYMMQRGAISSKIYTDNANQDCLIHSRWPSRSLRDANWPLVEAAEIPQEVTAATANMAECVQSKQSLVLDSAGLKQYIEQQSLQLIDEVLTGKTNILVYNDEGVSNLVYDVIALLQQVVDLDICRILMVNGDMLCNSHWEDTARLLIIPGGRARPYYTALGTAWQEDRVEKGSVRKIADIGVGNERVKNFVAQGRGNFLGICAGAYYGARETVFERGGEHEVLDEGALNFFPGVAEGPAYGLGKFQYKSEAGAEVAQIKSAGTINREVNCYFNGGCFFHQNDDPIPHENILATYTNVNKQTPDEKESSPAAIVETSVGFGKAILSGVHFECLSSTQRDISSIVRDALAAHDQSRRLLFAEIINRLGVPVQQTFYEQLHAQTVLPSALPPLAPLVEHRHFSTIDSTQTYTKAHVADLKPGQWMLVTADMQTAGRGAADRKWESPKGNVFATFSILLPPGINLEGFANFALVSALAVASVLEKYDLTTQVKWPNDVLVNGKKISGILSEICPVVDGQLALCIGIGVNVSMTPRQCDRISQPATALNLALGHEKIDKEIVTSSLTRSLSAYFDYFIQHGFSSFEASIQEKMAFLNEEITLDIESSNPAQRYVKGRLIGVNEKGYLVVDTRDGKQEFLSGRILKGAELSAANKSSGQLSGLNQQGLYAASSVEPSGNDAEQTDEILRLES